MLAENVENWFVEARQEGRQGGMLEQAIQMIRDFNLPIKKVADKYKLSVDEFVRRLNQEGSSKH
ncbi:hypothetical protein JX580_05675 [Thiomicrospira microaerophila]|uniref:hypothetical protein n=1 Tax=Thiomicrospira microaerophila TaxID=406020 RepID=UPI00200DC882|nr:hypothetical protein [Thiomicrospira microaerophila]UQB43350.1 hypothetical protein JX580_05675 [Thiomicrospira microaerophila]